MHDYLPYGRQDISERDIAAVAEALRAPLITQGPAIERFENAMADYLGARHVVAYSSGTAALHGAAFAAGLQPGDEVLTTPLTFAASANCALYLGATPRFVDISLDTWNLDVCRAADTVGDQTRVVVAKAMTTGEGGLAATEHDELARRLRLFRTHGITREQISPGPTDGAWYYEMQALGFNYRITDFQCALGTSQLDRLEVWVSRRNEIAATYRELLGDDSRIALPPAAPDGWLHAYHLFPIRVLAGLQARLAVFEALRAAGIGVQVHYIPVYALPYYRDALGYPQDNCPTTEEVYSGLISLPMFPGMTDADINRVVDELRAALA